MYANASAQCSKMIRFTEKYNLIEQKKPQAKLRFSCGN